MRTLKYRDRGKEVLDVQSRLKRLGYDLGTDGVDGYFGEDTEKAIKLFQQNNGLVADGVVADNTWCELVEARYEPGERLLYLRIPPFRGADVLYLQRSLNKLGFNAGPEDGILGPSTEHAVLDFQKNSGLVEDGMVDESVLRLLARVTKDGEPHAASAKIPDRNGGYAGGRTLDRLVVAIDPGHGGEDGGNVMPSGMCEKDLNLKVAQGLARTLEKSGAQVIMTRSGDEDVPVYDRPQMANNAGAHIFLSIHHNAECTGRAQGSCGYYFQREGYFSEAGHMLASHIVESLSAKLGVPALPVMGRNFAVLRETEMTAVMIEPLFLTAAGMSEPDSEAISAEAEAFFLGIREYFSVR